VTDQLHQACHRARRSAMELTAVGQVAAPGSRVILVGEDNPLSGQPEHALLHVPPGHAGHRLQSLVLGLTPAVYLAMWRVNLCAAAWDTKEARKRAYDEILDLDAPWSLVVMLGSKVASAFAPSDSAVKLAPFTSTQHVVQRSSGLAIARKTFTLAALPHPSARCRTWNETDAVQRARSMLRELAPEVPWGTA